MHFHRMTVSVLKMHFCKLTPKVISYRDFKKFENEGFMDSLYLALKSQNTDYTKNPDLFFNICENELNHHALRKKSTTVADKNRLAFTRQRNFCVFLLRKEKKAK